MLVHELIDENSKLGFETDDPERRLVELNFLFKPGMRRVVRTQNRERAVGNSLQDCIEISL